MLGSSDWAKTRQDGAEHQWNSEVEKAGSEEIAAAVWSDRQFQLLFELSSDAMVIVDDLGHCVEVNPAACSLLERSRLDLLGCSLVDLSTAPFDQGQFWVELRQQGQAHGHLDIAYTDGSQQQIDFRAIADFAPQRHLWVLRHSAEHRPIAAATQNQPPPERPNIPYAAASQVGSQVGSQQVNSPLPAAHHNLVDEHQHRQPAETVWHNDQHQWQRLFDALPVGVAYINRDGCYGYANQVYQTWFRPSPADIAGQAFNVVLGSMGYEHIHPQIDRVLAGEPVTY
ncbi:MAG TPA: PAS domain-containing protein, partial [Chroococcidiopsis sp.]